ncbi:hypothetical protein C7271_21205 [filamentous cyanobacterium CCP5]|nr:hypothetical protein C7293_31290 [filamentous cyanobacterium CCT1]PSN15067.1 hypothetical protein C7271_21205 [filamentous cyanobacterium CCP5]
MLNAQPGTVSATETTSTNILGPSYFLLKDLRVAGQAGLPEEPTQIAPGQSPFIVATNEEVKVSVDVEFNDTPLTRLLLCLGLKVEVHFAFEGVGGKAAEVDVSVDLRTFKGQRSYTLTWTGTPESIGMGKGLYGVAAIASISPAEHECSQEVIGYGYIAARLLQVYPA